MIQEEQNYFIIEREVLALIYPVKKIHHYLLGNSFKFIIDRHALT